MELVSYHFDHTTQKSVLGSAFNRDITRANSSFLLMQDSMFPKADQITEQNPSINGAADGSEDAFHKKTAVAVDMFRRAWNHGIAASFVLFDSWYAHDVLITDIMEIGYGVICRLKSSKVKYSYEGCQYTLKQLWQNVAKKKARIIHLLGGLPEGNTAEIGRNIDSICIRREKRLACIFVH